MPLLTPALPRRRAFALAAAFSVPACAPVLPAGRIEPAVTPLAEELTRLQAAVADEYRIGAGDQLDIRFPHRPELDQTETVRPDGRINPVLLGEVPAAGRTPWEVRSALDQGYRALAARTPPPAQRAYLIQAGDQLDIRFTYATEFNDQALVRPDGRISLAVVGAVIAEGKTPERLSMELRGLYGQHLTQPELVVIVRGMVSRQYVAAGRVQFAPPNGLFDVQLVLRSSPPPKVFVGGEVLRPGEQPIAGPLSLLQALVAAGGATTTADLRSTAVIRRGRDNRPVIAILDMQSDLAGGPSSDVPLRPFDVVFVPRSRIATAGDFLEQHLFRLLPPLRNSSVGFSYLVTSGGI
jgi:polysaccharide export outer membrane protein